ncbi:P-loop ATPase, Sll1717 family [Aeromonas dhakensis]|uniref:P-loop ATPase, Sll1717 family n=1 Tax=Aeromonas dhakensis TaxID=196024 RepID=UPI001BFC365F|nr:hypothetical protein [Aeromonas dhakensis]HDT5886770.1 hypothetical protein [Aeromonas dhakensis]HEB4977802.1 hypothetical protein [Aeromonas dhakensis]
MRLDDLGITIKDLDFGAVDAESDRRLANYFINTPQVNEALSFRSAHFIGRKGSGKSSIFTQLPRLATKKYGALCNVNLMTPDQYAWGALRQYEESGLLPEQAHTNAWKFTIAVDAATTALETEDSSLDDGARKSLQQIKDFVSANFGSSIPTPAVTARRLLQGLGAFNLEAFGFGIGFERSKQDQPLTPQIIDLLLDAVGSVCSNVGVIIATDRLDDSWDGSDISKSLLIGLLKATKEINDKYSRPNGTGVHVVTFLRSDIYQTLRFDDKDKHRAIEEEISWSADLLRDLVNARLPIGVSVDNIFEDGDMRGSISPFNYLVKRTFLRPREIIQFLQLCQKRTMPTATFISKDTIRNAEELYSAWKIDDLKQEYRRVFEDFDELIESLRQTQHRFDSIGEFTDFLTKKTPRLVDKYGTRELMKRLFDASIIGVRLRDAGVARFRCEDPDLLLPSNGSVYIHQSLYKGLNISERRA